MDDDKKKHMKYLNYVLITLVIASKMSQYGNSGMSSTEVSKIQYILCKVYVKICLNAFIDKIGIAEVNWFFYVKEGRYTCNLCSVWIYGLHIMCKK